MNASEQTPIEKSPTNTRSRYNDTIQDQRANIVRHVNTNQMRLVGHDTKSLNLNNRKHR